MFKFKPKPSFFDSSYPYLNQYHSLTKHKGPCNNYLFIHPAQSNNLYFNDNNKKKFHTVAANNQVLHKSILTSSEEDLLKKLEILEKQNNKLKIHDKAELQHIISDLNRNYNKNLSLDSLKQLQIAQKQHLIDANANEKQHISVATEAPPATKSPAFHDDLSFLEIDESDLSAIAKATDPLITGDDFYRSHWKIIRNLIKRNDYNMILPVYCSLQRNNYTDFLDIDLYNILLKSISKRTLNESIEEKLTNYLNIYKDLLDLKIKPNQITYNIILYNLFDSAIKSFKLKESLASSYFQIGLDLFSTVWSANVEVLKRLLICFNMFPDLTTTKPFKDLISRCEGSVLDSTELFQVSVINFSKFINDQSLFDFYRRFIFNTSNPNVNNIILECLILHNDLPLAVKLLDDLIVKVRETDGDETQVLNYVLHFANGLIETNQLDKAWDILKSFKVDFVTGGQSLISKSIYEKLYVKHCLSGDLNKAFTIWEYAQLQNLNRDHIDWDNDVQFIVNMNLWGLEDSEFILLKAAIKSVNKTMIFKLLKKFLMDDTKIEITTLNSLVNFLESIDEKDLLSKVIVAQSRHYKNLNHYLSLIIDSIPSAIQMNILNFKFVRKCFESFNLIDDEIYGISQVIGINTNKLIDELSMLSYIIKVFHNSEYVYIELPEAHAKLKADAEEKFRKLINQYMNSKLPPYVSNQIYDACALLGICEFEKTLLNYEDNWDVDYEIDLLNEIRSLKSLGPDMAGDAVLVINRFSNEFQRLTKKGYKFTPASWKELLSVNSISDSADWIHSISLLKSEDVNDVFNDLAQRKLQSSTTEKVIELVISKDLNVEIPVFNLREIDFSLLKKYIAYTHKNLHSKEFTRSVISHLEDELAKEKDYAKLYELRSYDISLKNLIKALLFAEDFTNPNIVLGHINIEAIDNIDLLNDALEYFIKCRDAERVQDIVNRLSCLHNNNKGTIYNPRTNDLLSFCMLNFKNTHPVSLSQSMSLTEISNNLLSMSFKDQIISTKQLLMCHEKDQSNSVSLSPMQLCTQMFDNLIFIIKYGNLTPEEIMIMLHNILKFIKFFELEINFPIMLNILKILSFTSKENLTTIWNQFLGSNNKTGLSNSLNFFFCKIYLSNVEKFKVFHWFNSFWLFQKDSVNIEKCKSIIEIDLPDNVTLNSILDFK